MIMLPQQGKKYPLNPNVELYICFLPDEERLPLIFSEGLRAFPAGKKRVLPHGISTLWQVVGSVVRWAALPPRKIHLSIGDYSKRPDVFL